MSESNIYIHGTQPTEQDRLARLNRLTNPAFVEFLRVPAGARVLEVGTGLGILAADVAAAGEHVHVIGIERACAQIDAAVQDPRVRYVRSDAHDLPFSSETFDLTYTRFVLEHVGDATRVLQEMHRVTRRGGRVVACENDITLIRFDPPCAAFDVVWNAFRRYQQQLGGDGQIGCRLYRLFRAAGFSTITLTVQPEVHWHGSPGFADWVRNLAGNVESAREGLVTSGFCDGRAIDHAIVELEALNQNPDASSCFVWNRAEAIRT